MMLLNFIFARSKLYLLDLMIEAHAHTQAPKITPRQINGGGVHTHAQKHK